MKTQISTCNKINRNTNAIGYMEICNEIFAKLGIDKHVDCEHNGYTMSYNEFKTTCYRKNANDFQVTISLDFNSQAAVLTIKD